MVCAINLAEKSQNGMLVGIFLLNLHIFIACKFIYMRNFLKRHTYNHMKLHIVAHLKYKDIWRQSGKKHSWILSGIFQIKLWRTNLQNCTKQLTQVSFHYASTIWLLQFHEKIKSRANISGKILKDLCVPFKNSGKCLYF